MYGLHCPFDKNHVESCAIDLDERVLDMEELHAPHGDSAKVICQWLLSLNTTWC